MKILKVRDGHVTTSCGGEATGPGTEQELGTYRASSPFNRRCRKKIKVKNICTRPKKKKKQSQTHNGRTRTAELPWDTPCTRVHR